MIGLRPDLAEAWSNRALALRKLGRHDDALASCEQAIALDPDYAGSWANRAAVLFDLGRLEDSLASHDRAIALQPGCAAVHEDRGLVLVRVRRFDEAMASFRIAIAQQPDNVTACANYAMLLAEHGHHDKALVQYDRAIALRPDLPDASWNKSLCLLAIGRYAEAWPLYEWRKRLNPSMGQVTFQGPVWQGDAALDGKTLFIHWEQGHGDTIQFCRYAALAVARGARVVMSAQDALRPLLSQFTPPVEIVDNYYSTIGFHYHCPMMSLPLAFGTTLETIPAPSAYIVADPIRTQRWTGRLQLHGALRVGIAWRGNPLFANDQARPTDYATIRRLLEIDADWIRLLKEPTEQDRLSMQQDSRVRLLGDDLTDFSDTAAVIALLDLVITTDTAIAHFAGATGKPVWILLSYAPDWRWLLHRSDSPWYPSARLFRQTGMGDWSRVIADVHHALIGLAS